MQKLCELSGMEPFTHQASFPSQRLGLTVHLKVSAKSFRAVHEAGGIDQWLRHTPKGKMTKKAARLKWETRA